MIFKAYNIPSDCISPSIKQSAYKNCYDNIGSIILSFYFNVSSCITVVSLNLFFYDGLYLGFRNGYKSKYNPGNLLLYFKFFNHFIISGFMLWRNCITYSIAARKQNS